MPDLVSGHNANDILKTAQVSSKGKLNNKIILVDIWPPFKTPLYLGWGGWSGNPNFFPRLPGSASKVRVVVGG